jgi:serine/threonine protein kinase
MAFGRRAFQESLLIRLIEAILHQPPPFPRSLNPQVSAELERIIAKTLEKNRDLRYQNAADLRADLAHLKRNTPSFTALGDANILRGETSK